MEHRYPKVNLLMMILQLLRYFQSGLHSFVTMRCATVWGRVRGGWDRLWWDFQVAHVEASYMIKYVKAGRTPDNYMMKYMAAGSIPEGYMIKNVDAGLDPDMKKVSYKTEWKKKWNL